ncbi:MAG: lipoprotein-releasing ABC transporter permease subunit [Gammaproteobacteria bacterium]|nr:lipoprotein-releasing ABC transporter permease subunit [Gammaproteobacteria bacterium]MCP5425101.1 lipoprotein-releasing ABC transporter permease subunit [Gammaproteobacteria bacterium]
MFRPWEIFIGLRYTRAKRRNHFISFISLSSMLGMALGITALITVLSVMNGAVKEVRDRILDMAAHATISSWDGRLADWHNVLETAKQNPKVLNGAPFIRGEAMLTNSSWVSGTIIQGVLPDQEKTVSDIAKKMVAGSLDDLHPGAFGIILGKTLAEVLGGVIVGDKVTVIIPQANVTPVGVMPRLKRFTVVGIFDSGMYEYDRGLALIHIADAATLFRLNDNVSGIRLKLTDLFQAPLVAREITQHLPGNAYRVRDWTQEHANFFRAVQTEKTAMFVILMLIVAVAAFNIVSTLVMVVTDKQADIAILRTLGASPMSIMGVFIVQGTSIGLIGTLLGTLGGVSLASNLHVVVPFIENLFDIKFMSPDVYLISDVPSQLLWSDVWTIAGVGFGLAVLATLYPAWRASRTQPADALRYE